MLAGMWIAFLVNLTAFPLSGGLLPYVAREVYQMDQTGLGMLVASFASRRLGRLGWPDIHWSLHSARAPHDHLCRHLVCHAAGLRADARRARGQRLSGRRWLCPEHEHGAAGDHAAAHGGARIPRTRHGRAHAGDLQPADRSLGRRRADRAHRLSRHGDAVCRDRPAVHGADRPASGAPPYGTCSPSAMRGEARPPYPPPSSRAQHIRRHGHQALSAFHDGLRQGRRRPPPGFRQRTAPRRLRERLLCRRAPDAGRCGRDRFRLPPDRTGADRAWRR